MLLVDSHCHLDQINLDKVAENSVEELIAAAQARDIAHMLCVCISLENRQVVYDLAQQFQCVTASVGKHPADKGGEEPTLEQLIAWAEQPNVVAIGETGLDYFHCKGDVIWQQERFRRHIQAAKAVNKPLIIHTRDAREDTIRILKEENAQTVGGVFHCFTETSEMARAGIELGFKISFSGIITFKNAKNVQEAARDISLEHILVETDAPYLAPTPHRGRENQPAYVRDVAQFMADFKEVPLETLAEITTHNYLACFGERYHQHLI